MPFRQLVNATAGKNQKIPLNFQASKSMQDNIPSDITIGYDGFSHFESVRALNYRIFGEKRLINRLDHHPLIFLTAHCDGVLAGFKIGYALNRDAFYSAKGATSPLFRFRGIASRLLFTMMAKASELGYRELHFDTFPNKHPGMVIIGLKNDFHIKNLSWSNEYRDFRVRMWRTIK